MKTLLPFTLLFFISINSFSQLKKLTLYKSFGGVVYQMDTITLSGKQVLTVLRKNLEAYDEFKLARRKSRIATVLGFTGGVLIALPLATAAAGGKPEWVFAGVGGGLFLLSIPFTISFRGHAYNAFEIYNSSLTTSRVKKIHPSFHFYGTGAAITLRF